ncbi:Acetyl-coenzyme A carboxylase carboxyl transferase subunit alpha, chloroplastic [Sesamum angolense]|uniref:acetyl-CoA carboxytransferase n=1 Tax=Sesamum angolense TaxID=2727404 RepID=A0AAE2BSH6_9LAMI|nr:Acetyl-coenzyme A carboxylase carboxyl transferase subunit alpha, chloroplastic [Sesamum angolense]
MASMAQSPVSFTGNLASKPTASDLLRSSINGACGVPLRALGKAQLGAKRRDFAISAKVRKVKKHDYPWPEDPDPNEGWSPYSPLTFQAFKREAKAGNVITGFSPFYLLIQVQKMANETGLDFSDQIISLENKYQKFVELHGDRAGYDDPAVVTGLGTINGRSYMFMGHQKGRNTKENIKRNFGMPTPHGYRKALRMMYYADHHGFPIVTFIDTPGAYADLKSEELGQGEAIAHNLRTMFGLKVPIVSIVIGEGGSGGALAIDFITFTLLLPEACAAILWKSAKASPKAAEKLKITATELTKLQIADGAIPEPLGGAHADPYWTSQQIKTAIVESMDELVKMDTETLLKHRAQKFRKLGGFQEGIPIDPKRKVNMKKKEQPIVPISKTSEVELRNEVERVKQQIIEASKSSTGAPATRLKEVIEKLKRELDYEYDEAAKALELKERVQKLSKELDSEFRDVLKSFGLQVVPSAPAAMAKIDAFGEEVSMIIDDFVNSSDLKDKIEMLKVEVGKTGNTPDGDSKSKIQALETEIKQAIIEAISSPELREKHERLATEVLEATKSSVESTTDDQSKFDESRVKIVGLGQKDLLKLHQDAPKNFFNHFSNLYSLLTSRRDPEIRVTKT